MPSIPEDFLFRFSFPIRKLAAFPTAAKPVALGKEYSLGTFRRYHMEPEPVKKRLAASHSASVSDKRPEDGEGARPPVDFDFRLAWHERGIVITTVLSGKTAPLQCDPTRLEYSDGLRFCLDTRDVRDVHRGTRFCHRLFFMPNSSDSQAAEPVAFWLPIHRAKSPPNPVDVSHFALAGAINESGYALSILIPGEDLTGYAPLEYRRLGVYYSVMDTELGLFTLQHSPLFPTEEDPSLWSALDLVDEVPDVAKRTGSA